HHRAAVVVRRAVRAGGGPARPRRDRDRHRGPAALHHAVRPHPATGVAAHPPAPPRPGGRRRGGPDRRGVPPPEGGAAGGEDEPMRVRTRDRLLQHALNPHGLAAAWWSRRATARLCRRLATDDDPALVEAIARIAWSAPDAEASHRALTALTRRGDDPILV